MKIFRRLLVLIAILVAIYFLPDFDKKVGLPLSAYQEKQLSEFLSLTKGVGEHKDLKTAQITHTDGTPVRFTLASFNYDITGTTGGFVDGMKEIMKIAYRNPDNDIPRIQLTVLVHELVHLSTLHYGLIKQKCRTDVLDNECQEKFAYDAQFLLEQVLQLEKDGWLIIDKE